MTAADVPNGKGKGKAPPLPKAKGVGKGYKAVKEPGESPTKICATRAALPKPQADEALRALARLQRPDGAWDDSEELTAALGLRADALVLEKLPKRPSFELVATALARQALERCCSILTAERVGQGEDEKVARAAVLAEAAEHSSLGPSMLDAAGQWLDAKWLGADAVLRPKMELKVSQLLEDRLPRPQWKAQLKAKMAIHKTCEKCGANYTAAVGRCLACFPPERPRLQTDSPMSRWRELPAAPISQDLEWEPRGLLHCEGGSGGVTLMELPKGVVGVKPQRMTAAAEFLAIQVAKVLDIRVADMRLVPWMDPEFKAIKEAISKAPVPEHEGRDLAGTYQTALLHFRRTEFLGILEYIPGLSVQGLEVHKRLQDMAPKLLREFWIQVGQIVAFDALINNVDRVPLLWDNDGNTANLMLLEAEAPLVVGIDQAVTPIMAAGPGRERYLARLAELARALFTSQVKEFARISSSLSRVSECFLLCCGVAMDEAALCEGLLRSFSHLADLVEAGRFAQELDEAIDAAGKVFRAATVDVGCKSLPLMRDFLLATASTIADARSQEPTLQ